MQYFRGYVLTNGKKCIEKFKDRTDLKTYNDVKNAESFAGVLADNTVLIDIDDTVQADILYSIVTDRHINCRIYQTTRGKHFLFKDDGKIKQCATNVPLACGLRADIKVGKKNSYSILKIHGTERQMIQDSEEPDKVPYFLRPVASAKEMVNLKEHDARNSALFGYILSLQAAGMSTEDARDTIKIINSYVFAEALPDEELEVILRDEAFQTTLFFDEDNKFQFDVFAEFIKNKEHVIRLNGQLHTYKDGIYVTGTDVIEAAMIKYLPKLSRSRRQEVLEYIKLIVPDDVQPAPPNIIGFKNGLYDVLTDEFSSFTPEVVITNLIPWNYSENAHSDAIDTMLNNVSCNDIGVRAVLEEVAGSCMYRSNTLAGGKAVMLTGSGANGKSTYLKTVSNMLSEKNTSALDLKRLDDRFSTVMMYNKLANIGDDISDEFIVDTATFKKIVTGETIDAEQKGQPKFNFKPFCKLLFSANAIPRLGKGADAQAILRRLIIVPFKANFKTSDVAFNPNIEYELKTDESMEYMIQLALKGLKRLLKVNNYTTCAAVETELDEYSVINNPVLGFLRHCEEENININGELTRRVYEKYEGFCVSENLKPLSLAAFTRQLKGYDYEVKVANINKKSVRIYIRSGE